MTNLRKFLYLSLLLILPLNAGQKGTFSKIIQKVSPYVVSLFDFPNQSSGSGIILSPEKGFIITNAHIVKSKSTITVQLSDGSKRLGRVIGFDADSDIAVVSIKPIKNMTVPSIEHFNSLEVGDLVIAIGNSKNFTGIYGNFEHSATLGMIGALLRGPIMTDQYPSIQTDALIVQGNSGGALINISGDLVGIPTSIDITPVFEDGLVNPFQSRGSTASGLGFVIPIDIAVNVAKQIIEFGKFERVSLGVMLQNPTSDMFESLNIDKKNKGSIVMMVAPGSYAFDAQVKVGDLITHIGEDEVINRNSAIISLTKYKPGDELSVKVIRNSEPLVLKAKAKIYKESNEPKDKFDQYFNSTILQNYEYHSQSDLGTINGIKCLNITSLDSKSFHSGLMPYDIIIEVNKTPVKNIQELKNAVEKAEDMLLVLILRNEVKMYITMHPSIIQN
jgi:S1-C subfamily serine protease